MLSKKVSGSGLLNAAAGIDRGRVGERLRAALAGLQELHLLKEKQRNMVFWAVRLHREEPVSSEDPGAENPEVETEEQRLEATLTALKQQLSRLRRQDVGLKSHLQQLDQQISELKLDVCKVSSEHLETDSRPSSGFYDLSDGGSGSLSNSCTSVYSECLSSSQTSLPPTSSHLIWSPGPPESSRRRSADESAAQGESPRGAGVRLGSSWIRTGTGSVDHARQRPVSTGDLERILISVPGFDGKKPSTCHNMRHPTVDPKYQSNLVCRGGTEVYRYPSPLHAVALQSPIFSISGDGASPSALGPAGALGGATHTSDSSGTHSVGSEQRPVTYINKLLQRSLSKTSLQGEAGKDRPQHSSWSHVEAPAEITGISGVNGSLALGPQEQRREQPLEVGGTPATLHCSQELASCISPASIPNHAAEGPRPCHCYPAVISKSKPGETVTPSNVSSSVQEEGKSGTDAQNSRGQLSGASVARKLSDKRPRLGRSTSKDEGRGQDRTPVGGAQAEFVHAQFVPARSQRVKVRQADRKTKAVRLRKRSCEKPRVTKEPQVPVEVGREAGPGVDCGPKQAGLVKSSRKLANRGEGRGRSCSESSLCGPAFPHPASQLPPQLDPPLRSKKARRPPNQLFPLAEPARRKQVTRKWSAVEMGGQRGQEVPMLAAKQMSGATTRGVSTRPRAVQWGGHPYATSSSSSYFGSYSSRYPPAPYAISRSRHPPRSESEYSADCASLFHSTIAESSEGELSDFTTNRFGDRESSCDSHSDSRSISDSDSSLSLDEEEEEDDDGGLVWAEATMGPTAAGFSLPQPRTEPPACRIKASRALKKKIRHFQPEALKVMTLV
ncbi:hypothetical protein GJAV_G00240250 [Gymnothorax javanicus]|nr:hypothetical protein GJAV_G00240250 [Gymnothorax javanicus]